MSSLREPSGDDLPCPTCGRAMPRLDGAICPECGSALDLASQTEPAREIPLGEVLAWPFIDIIIFAVNAIAFLIARFFPPQLPPVAQFFYGILLLALILAWSIWQGLNTDVDESIATFRQRLNPTVFLLNLLGMNLSRAPGALVWAPLATLVLTLIHAAFLIIAWLT